MIDIVGYIVFDVPDPVEGREADTIIWREVIEAIESEFYLKFIGGENGVVALSFFSFANRLGQKRQCLHNVEALVGQISTGVRAHVMASDDETGFDYQFEVNRPRL